MLARSNKNGWRFEASAKNPASATCFYPHGDENEEANGLFFNKLLNCSEPQSLCFGYGDAASTIPAVLDPD